MSEKIVQLNEEAIKGQLKELVRGSVEETLNKLLEAEAEKLTQAARYERNEARQGYRSGHYSRNLTTTSGDVTLHVPRLKGVSFETAIMEKQFWKQGGSRALEKFKTSYPEVFLQSAFSGNCNQFKIDFGDNVFDVNEMSEIIVPNLILMSATTQLQFKHPKGLFKYYYIDVDEISRTIDDELFATISGLYGLLHGLHGRFKNQAEVEKIFIYYSDMARIDYQIIYNNMSDLLKSPELEGSKIVLCSG